MPDLGNRANVMGPQPIGPIRQPDPDMIATIDKFLGALIAGKKEEALAVTHQQAHDRVSSIADAVKPCGYSEIEVLGKARVAEHYFVKARLSGSKHKPFIVQFRIGADGGTWTIREATDLSEARSAWSK